ncbi:hypothetical protein ACFCZ3_20040 [Cellulosimicrobium cellulans]|uniref:hypothetical protein n=1 Tax=Cellulosimicrobium cellulans TaxID=1710 RepID=UPI0035DD4BFE
MTTLETMARAEAESLWPHDHYRTERPTVGERARRAFVRGAEWGAALPLAIVTTVAALDALPVGSVVRLASGQVFVRVDDGRFGWEAPGDRQRWTAVGVIAEHPDAPVAVLYRPCCGDGPDGYCPACPERPRATPTRDDVAAAILARYSSFDPITARALADVVAPLYEGTRP